ncbi:hypothetical protein WH91_05265 [Devosia psychrophila]|nr:hypothetical protein WH91_05265 [Devosia psychrophila]
MLHLTEDAASPVLVYDGECPFCSQYVKYFRLQSALGALKLVDARDGGTIVEAIRAANYDLNEGMVLILSGQMHHGPDAIHMLALMSSGNGYFNRLNAFIFRRKWLSTLLYPMLRTGRNFTLWCLGRKKLR